MKRFLKKTLIFFAGAVLLLLLLLVGTERWISGQGARQLFTDAASLPENKAGLVLGCSPFLRGGGTNLFYRYRMEAALEIFRAGKVSYLIVSGDNHTRGYDETSAMKKSLMAMGVPEERIVCDYAGFSTFDSMIRAQKVFGQNSITIVTQRDHALRALYICRQLGLNAVAYPARDVGAQAGFKTKLRESLARVRAILDLYLFKRQPEFPGDPVPVGVDPS